jgi:hypothetical protein
VKKENQYCLGCDGLPDDYIREYTFGHHCFKDKDGLHLVFSQEEPDDDDCLFDSVEKELKSKCPFNNTQNAICAMCDTDQFREESLTYIDYKDGESRHDILKEVLGLEELAKICQEYVDYEKHLLFRKYRFR